MILRTETPRLTRIVDALERRRYLRDIGSVGVREIGLNFSTQGANIGHKWKPLKVRQGKRGRAGAPLRNKGLMAQSVRAETQYTQGVVALSVTRTAPWKGHGRVNLAWVHDHGATIPVTNKMRVWMKHNLGRWTLKKEIRIPARPFMQISERGMQEVRELVGNDLWGRE